MHTKSIETVPNDIARFLGATVKRVEKDINGFFFFSKKPVVQPKLNETVSAKPADVITPAAKAPEARRHSFFRVHQPAAPVRAATPACVITVKTAPQEKELKGIIFENKVEQVKAEIFFKDIQSPVSKVRMSALEHLTELSKPTAIKILEKLLSSEQDALKIVETLNALAGVGDETVVSKQMFKEFTGHKDAGVRQAALRAISKYHDDESFHILTAHVKDKDPEVRRQVLNCLCWSFGVKCEAYAVTALHDLDAKVRKTACQIAGALKIKQSVSGLISLLGDQDRHVQESASHALKKITGEDFEFRVTGSKQDKEAAIEDWKFWWRDNQTKFIMEEGQKSKGKSQK